MSPLSALGYSQTLPTLILNLEIWPIANQDNIQLIQTFIPGNNVIPVLHYSSDQRKATIH